MRKKNGHGHVHMLGIADLKLKKENKVFVPNAQVRFETCGYFKKLKLPTMDTIWKLLNMKSASS